MRKLGHFLVGAVTLAVGAGSASATAIYVYAGNNFTSITNGTVPGTFTTAMSVSGSFTLAAPLAANLSALDITGSIQSFTFSDGRGTYTEQSTLDAIKSFIVSTDSSGAINEWGVYLRDSNFYPNHSINTCNSPSVSIDYCGQYVLDTGDIRSPGLSADIGNNSNNPGSWSLVPEPSTALLLASGLAGLAVRRERVS